MILKWYKMSDQASQPLYFIKKDTKPALAGTYSPYGI